MGLLRFLFPVLLAAATAAASAREDGSAGSIPIRLILIDEKTETSLGPLPWPRSRHAEMIDILSEAGARAIVLRMYFKSHGDEETDRTLVEAIAKSGRVYIEMSRARDPEAEPPGENWLSRMSLSVQGKPPRRTVSLKYAQIPFGTLAAAVRGIGAVDILRDRDGTLMGIPLFVKYRDRIFPSLALRIFLDLKGASALPLVFEEREFLWIGPKRFGLDKYGCTPVSLQPSDGYKKASFVDVIKGRVKPALFEDSVVIICPAGPEMKVATAAGSRNAAELLADQLATLLETFDKTSPAASGVK